jgi:DNA-binding transcriptional MocR family regulator
VSDVGQLQDADLDAVVLSPAHQYPTGTVLSPERRAQLIAWACRHGALVVEDDYDAEYRYDREPIASLQGLAPDCVAYIGTASKTLAPVLRLAWVLVPSHLVGEMAAQHGVARALPSVLVQAPTRRCSNAARSIDTCGVPAGDTTPVGTLSSRRLNSGCRKGRSAEPRPDFT